MSKEFRVYMYLNGLVNDEMDVTYVPLATVVRLHYGLYKFGCTIWEY